MWILNNAALAPKICVDTAENEWRKDPDIEIEGDHFNTTVGESCGRASQRTTGCTACSASCFFLRMESRAGEICAAQIPRALCQSYRRIESHSQPTMPSSYVARLSDEADILNVIVGILIFSNEGDVGHLVLRVFVIGSSTLL